MVPPLLKYSYSELFHIFKTCYKIQRQFKSFEEADGNIQWDPRYICNDNQEIFFQLSQEHAEQVSSPFSITSQPLSYIFKYNFNSSVDVDGTTRARLFVRNIQSTYEQPLLRHRSTDLIKYTPLLIYFAQLWGITPLPSLDDYIPSTFYIHPTIHAEPYTDKHKPISYAGSFITFIPLHLLNLYCVYLFIDKFTCNIFALPINDISHISLPHDLVPLKYIPIDIYSFLLSPNIPKKDIIFSSPSH
jgi:hypothetical protein